MEKIAVDDRTVILVRDTGLAVDCDLPPRARTQRLRRLIRLAVGKLVADGKKIQRTRTHHFESSGGYAHCVGCCADSLPRVMLCQVCGMCRTCCASHAWEEFWWEDDTPCGLAVINDKIEAMEWKKQFLGAEIQRSDRHIRGLGGDFERIVPYLGLSNRKFAEATGYCYISAGDRKVLARIAAVGGLEEANRKYDRWTIDVDRQIAELRQHREELLAEFNSSDQCSPLAELLGAIEK